MVGEFPPSCTRAKIAGILQSIGSASAASPISLSYCRRNPGNCKALVWAMAGVGVAGVGRMLGCIGGWGWRSVVDLARTGRQLRLDLGMCSCSLFCRGFTLSERSKTFDPPCLSARILDKINYFVEGRAKNQKLTHNSGLMGKI